MTWQSELLHALRKTGYRTNFGDDDSGFVFLALKRGGGYYLGKPSCLARSPIVLINCASDVGACQQIIDGKIKVKNDAQIERFTKTGLKFDDGSEIEADVVMFATGYV